MLCNIAMFNLQMRNTWMIINLYHPISPIPSSSAFPVRIIEAKSLHMSETQESNLPPLESKTSMQRLRSATPVSEMGGTAYPDPIDSGELDAGEEITLLLYPYRIPRILYFNDYLIIITYIGN